MNLTINNWAEYVGLANRTAKALPLNPQLVHARLGLITEVGELADLYKRHLIYGKDFDLVNFREEVGDIMWYVALECQTMKFTLFPDFSPTDAAVSEVDLLLSLARITGHLAGDQSTTLLLEVVLRKLHLICMVRGVDIKVCMGINIAKLALRYGEKYSDEAALIRNLQEERKLLSQ